ncbi:MAG: hypothetical protein DHS20C16_33390 [Phycisphaerae bacterium]|nr:MAG: hypothetical protein DHS20C16_33390 [Phycisphaerae bacterium]
MTDEFYCDAIRNLPEADIPFPGVRGWLSQAEDHQVCFFDIEPIGEVTPHSHGEQWGVVLEGRMKLTIGGEEKEYGPGDAYHIPAGVTHGATFLTRVRVIDYFADRARYKPK